MDRIRSRMEVKFEGIDEELNILTNSTDELDET